MTNIKLLNSQTQFIAKEGYGTIKKRIYTGDLFVELTIDFQKMLQNKTNIDQIRDIPKKEKIAEKKDKRQLNK